MINRFIEQFTTKKYPNIIKIGNKHYLVSDELLAAKEKINLTPKSIGVYLGEEKNKKFNASLALIDQLSKDSDRKVYITKKAEWLFLCGRDLFGESIKKAQYSDPGFVLIQNMNDENLGLGEIVKPLTSKGIVIKNIIDKGDYLRREMSGKK